MNFRVETVLLFALIYPLHIFGDSNESEIRTEILLHTVSYEPEVEHIEAEVEGENGITTSYKVNGVEVDVSALESVIESIHERISRESIVINNQQQVISNFVGSILDSKGVEYDNLGTKLVVKELSPELIAELTQNFFFIEGVEENISISSDDIGWTVEEILKETNIDPLGFIDVPSYLISNGDYSSNIDVGIIQHESSHSCPDTSLESIDSKRIENHQGFSTKFQGHANRVAYILQQASKHAYIYCDKERDYTINPKDKDPKVYILSQSLGQDSSSYIDMDRKLDNFIFEKQIASFKSGGNYEKQVTSPGKAYNSITVSFFHKNPSSSNFSNIVYGKIDTKAQKPEIVAKGSINFPKELGGINHGSSYATPLVASGFGANLISQYPIFRYQPQLLKAFLMTISQNITGKGSPINEKEGAGTPNYENNFNFMRSWWNGTVEGWFKSNGSTLSKSRYLKAGRTYRIAISWLVHGDYTYKYKKPYLDFNLYIKKDGKEIQKSERESDTFELIEYTPTSSGTYTFEIKRSFYDLKNSRAKKSLYLGLAVTEIK